jgi:imidazoleglycerol-phosphate dehydratase
VAGRRRLEAALAALPGVRPLTSQANFCFFQLEGRVGREVAGALAERGILVRSYSDPALASAIRVTVGRPEQNDAFLAALRAVLACEPAAGRLPGGETAGDREEGRKVGMMQGRMAAREARGMGVAEEERAAGRQGQVERRTGETEVSVSLELDGSGRYEVDTGLGFLDHMLAQVAAHGLFDLAVRARGDLEVDEHHTVEDVAIGLGQALDAALGDRQGIARMGQAYAPLDEALALVVVDLSGRPYAVVDAEFSTPRLGAVGTDLIIHFLETLALRSRISLHARVLYGRNDHHKAEALFKALGRALDEATRLDPRRQGAPSTKGVL